ncbi:MAG TPA: acyl-CoA synthetase [Microthrixaceae bacterium]|nr:acyl-CoA synthetase [Microthrixaceae bacterium]
MATDSVSDTAPPSREQFNLATVSEVVAAAVPDREALIYGNVRLTFSQLADRTRRLASYLHSQGLGAHTERAELQNHESGQDHLAMFLYNGNEYIEGMLGSYKARVAPFNVNYRYVNEELLYLLTDANATAVMYHATFAPVLAEVLPQLPNVRVLIQVADDSGNELLPGAVDYEEIIAASSPEGPPVTPSPDDLYIVYTGGTTGMPKGVLWRQDDIFMNAMGGKEVGTWTEVSSAAEIAEKARNNTGFRLMALPPLMHGASQWASFMMLNGGSTVVLPTSHNLDPVEVWQTVEREKLMTFVVVGDAMARPILDEYKRGNYNAESLFVLGNGGAPLSAAIKEEFLEVMPNLLVNDSLGSSESGAQASHLSAKGGVSTGKFNPGPGAEVISDDMTKVLPAGHEGIGWMAQGGSVPLGYLGDAAKTARTFPTVEGARYSVPGDRAVRRADGEIDLLGRDSQCINSGGEKIFVEEVEMAIVSHPDVADVLVCGRPSERWGAEVTAVVALNEGASPTEAELSEHANKSIARYKLPKAWVFVDEIRRSPSGKADYRWAKGLAEESVEG